MAWVAVDRAVRTLEEWPELKGPLEKWRELRHEIFTEVCEKGYNEDVGAFTQYYGSRELDASVLMIPLVGFLPPKDPRVVSTVEAIQRELMEHGFVLRYRTSDDGAVDGLTGQEGAFLACSFWLVDCLHMIDRVEEAEELFERLLAIRTDLGLLSEEYDAEAGAPGGQLSAGVLPRVTDQFCVPPDGSRLVGANVRHVPACGRSIVHHESVPQSNRQARAPLQQAAHEIPVIRVSMSRG